MSWLILESPVRFRLKAASLFPFSLRASLQVMAWVAIVYLLLVANGSPAWAIVFGRDWRRATAAGPNRADGAALVHNDLIWFMGGMVSGAYYNNVWASANGLTWTAKPNGNWVGRRGLAAVSFAGYMYVMGGYRYTTSSAYYGDVWRSENGSSWTQTNAAAWTGRWSHAAVVFNNKIWVLGGWTSSSVMNDVWSSEDGYVWTRVLQNAPWAARMGHTTVVFNNKIWVIGGGANYTTKYSDVWSSPNGVDWTRETPAAGWSPRVHHTSVVNGGMIWVMGGRPASGGNPQGLATDVWYSSDGAVWTRATANAGWAGREEHASVIDDGKIWVIAGSLSAGISPTADVWYTQGNLFVGDHSGFYSSVADALAKALPGDEILVAPGIYQESITLKSDVSLIGGYTVPGTAEIRAGAPPIQVSVLDGGATLTQHVVIIDNVANSLLSGFVITGGRAQGEGNDNHGGGIFCKDVNSSVRITGCTLQGNAATESGGGIYCQNASPAITDCLIAGNTAARGAGIALAGASAPAVGACVIGGNVAGADGGGASVSQSGAIFLNCALSGNSAGERGGGLCLLDADTTVTNCTVDGNGAPQGGGILLDAGSRAFVANTILANNDHCAIFEANADSDAVTSNSLFFNNDADYCDENTTILSGAPAINELAEASQVIDGDPLFQMNGPGATMGNWTAGPTVHDDSGTSRSWLTDSAASFEIGALVGELIRVNSTRMRCSLITSNTTTMIEVLGDASDLAQSGDTYQVIDYHLQWLSPARYRANGWIAPAMDFEGDPRPGADGYTDIGMDEYFTLRTGAGCWRGYD